MNEMQAKILRWLLTGEVGQSSKTMAVVIALDEIPKRPSYPHDAGDFRRCLQLLETAPEMRALLYKMKAISIGWERLIDNWEKIEELYQQENGIVKNMPKTHALIRELTANPNEIRLGNMSIITY